MSSLPQKSEIKKPETKKPETKKSETKQPETRKPEEKSESWNKNLVLLGVGATLIALITTSISLIIYRESGDIYLDRSRPGFLPETEEAELDKDDSDYAFPDSGKITADVLDDYLDHLKSELNRLNDFSFDSFSEKPLSDESLGL